MTFREWEKQFKKALKGLSSQEKQTALEYYRELYGDKIEAGCTPEEAVSQFGSPIDCAQDILAENEPATTVPQQKTEKIKPVKPQKSCGVSTHSVSVIIGMVFLTLILIIPLYACLITFIAAFGAVAIGCAVGAVASLLLTILYPVYIAIYGAGWGAIVANLGMCLAAAGICTLLSIGFYFATKYFVVWSIRLFKRIYFKEERV